MTQRYARLSPDYMAAFVGKLDGIMMREALPENLPGGPQLVTTRSPASGIDLASTSSSRFLM